MRKRIISVLALALVFCTVAAAQAQQPVTYYADFHVKPGKDADFMNLVKKYDEPLFAKLMAEGAVLAWGVDVPVLHEPGSATHGVWWSVPDMGALDKVFAAFEAAEKKWADDHAKAVEAARSKKQPAPKSANEEFLDAVDISKHKDWLLRAQISNFTPGVPPPDLQPYSWITAVQVKPGKEAAFRQNFDKYVKPTLDRLVSDNSIIGYEFGIEEAKSTNDFTHYAWVVMPNLAAREKVRAAFNALNESRAPETRDQITESFLATYNPAATRNYVLRTIFLRVAPPK
jgi:hypothetical protein